MLESARKEDRADSELRTRCKTLGGGTTKESFIIVFFTKTAINKSKLFKWQL